MPTWNGGAPTTTGRWDNNTWNATFSFGGLATRAAGARWASVAVPQGAIITSATLAFTLSGEANTNRAVGIHQVDNAPALGNGQRTTDNTPNVDWASGGGAKSVNLTAGMQALVNRAGWASGNALVIRWDGQSADFSDRTISAVSLTVEYTHSRDLVIDTGVALWAPTAPTVAPGAVSITPGTVTLWALTAPLVQAAAVIAPGSVTLWAPTAPTVAPGSPAPLTVPPVTLWAPKAPAVTAQGTVTIAPTGVSFWNLSAPDLVRGYPIPPTPMDHQLLIASPAYLDAVNDRNYRATMSVDVLSPDRTTVRASLGSAHTTGPLAATRSGFSTIKVWQKGQSGRPTWSAELTTRDRTLLPGGINPDASLLDPFEHNFVRVWWWIVVDGDWQRIPLGTGTVDSIAVNHDANGFVMTVLVRDVLADIARARWDESVPIAGLPVSDATRAVVASRAPWAPVVITPTTERLPEDWSHGEPDTDPTEDLARLAYAHGSAARTTRLGDYIHDPIRDRNTAPVKARFISGPRERGDGITGLLSVSTALVDMDEVINACTIASASPSVDPPVSGSFEITDDTHPLWVGRRRYSRSMSNAIITTAEQATTMARNLVQQNAVTMRAVITHTPRPDLDTGDVVEVIDVPAGMVGRWTVVDFDLDGPLGPQSTVIETERTWAA